MTEIELQKHPGETFFSRPSITATLVTGEVIPYGFQGRKYRAILETDRFRIPVVVKEMESKKEAVRQISVISALEKTEVPVPRTRRYFQDSEGKHFIAFSDLSEDRRHLIWSINNPFEELSQFNLKNTDIESVRNQITKIHERTKGKFGIRYDSYFLRKRNFHSPNSEVEILIGDFGRVYSKSDTPYMNLITSYEEDGLKFAESLFIDQLKAAMRMTKGLNF